MRALWVTFPAPEGHRLDQHEAPLLQAEVERLRVAAGAPRLSGIVVDADLNAAAASVPRALGLLGHRHYLVLGLPLMQLLDRDTGEVRLPLTRLTAALIKVDPATIVSLFDLSELVADTKRAAKRLHGDGIAETRYPAGESHPPRSAPDSLEI